MARSQIERGAEVVFAGAGTSNFGVFQAAVEMKRLVIGVDSNQNGLHPGKVLTSMLKRVDNAVLKTYGAAKAGTWKGGVTALGLKEEGIGWALDDNNRALITPAMEQAANSAVADIVAGKIAVHDFTADGKCPFPLAPGG